MCLCIAQLHQKCADYEFINNNHHHEIFELAVWDLFLANAATKWCIYLFAFAFSMLLTNCEWTSFGQLSSRVVSHESRIQLAAIQWICRRNREKRIDTNGMKNINLLARLDRSGTWLLHGPDPVFSQPDISDSFVWIVWYEWSRAILFLQLWNELFGIIATRSTCLTKICQLSGRTIIEKDRPR